MWVGVVTLTRGVERLIVSPARAPSRDQVPRQFVLGKKLGRCSNQTHTRPGRAALDSHEDTTRRGTRATTDRFSEAREKRHEGPRSEGRQRHSRKGRTSRAETSCATPPPFKTRDQDLFLPSHQSPVTFGKVASITTAANVPRLCIRSVVTLQTRPLASRTYLRTYLLSRPRT